MEDAPEPTAVEQASEALRRHDWRRAFELLSEADADATLQPAELELLAQAAWWTGQLPQAIEVRERAYGAAVRSGEIDAAVMSAIALARDNLLRNDAAVAGAWITRAEHLLADVPQGRGHGYLAAVRSFRAALTGDVDRALADATLAVDIGRQTGDRNLAAFGMSEKGFALIVGGTVDEGLALIDEATVAAVGGELEPSTAGGVCCTSIEACAALGDWARAASWTEAQDRWCRREGINGYPGMCRLFRSEIKQLRGAWLEAEAEARQASVELEGYMPAAAGNAFYRIAELRLLRGDLAAAEEAVLRAHALGRDPQPVLSLLRLAQGRPEAALAGIRDALHDPSPLPNWRAPPGSPLHRLPLLRAQAEIAVAAGELETAAGAVDELGAIAERFGGEYFLATAGWARGVLALARGDAAAAADALRAAVADWNRLGGRYEAARTRAILADAYAALGNAEHAMLELHAARATFEDLGAAPDLRRADARLAALAAASGALEAPRQPADRVARTFVFTDIVDSTRLAEALGDDAWTRLLRWHDGIVRAIVAEYGGEEIKATGDGFFLAFADAGAALDAAAAIQRRLAQQTEDHGFAPSIRIGVHTAEASRSGLDYIGLGVNYAARIGAAASASEILVSEASLEGLNRTVRRSGSRTLTLRGISEPVAVTSVDWR